MADVADTDLFELWRRRQKVTASAAGRATREDELAFWQARASRYDETGSLAKAAPEVVERVVDLVWPGATVLEVGAGTGEFTLPVARQAAQVTALDLSPDMLNELCRKVAASGLMNITPREAAWEDTEAIPHDIVLAVNSLYSLRDPRVALTKIVTCARQRGILVRSIGANPPPPAAALAAFGASRYRLGSDHGLLVAGLVELGVAAQVEIVTTPRTYRFPALDDAAAVCLPWQNRTTSEWALARDLVEETMARDPSTGQVTYHYPGRVAIIVWDVEP